jgi:competence protein ComEC
MRKTCLFYIFIIILVVAAIWLRFIIAGFTEKDDIRNYVGSEKAFLCITGQIIDQPSRVPGGMTFLLNLDKLIFDGGYRPVKGKVWVRLYKGGWDFDYGDFVRVQGFLKKISFRGMQKSRIYMSSQQGGFILEKGRGNPLFKPVYSLNKKMIKTLERYIPGPEVFIIEAMILGQRGRIPKNIKELFRTTGTAHILAISGLHVGLIGFVVWLLLRIFMVPLRVSIIILALFLIFYCVFAGARIPIIRATIMAEIALLGRFINRKADPWRLLFLSAFIIFMIDPFSIFEPSFQLSFASVASIFYILPRLPKTGSRILSSIYVSASAWVGIMPIVGFYFGLFSPICLLANIIAVPLAFCAIITSILSAFGSLFSRHLGFAFGNSCWFLLKSLVSSMGIFSRLPLGHLNIAKPTVIEIALYYLIIILLLRFIPNARKFPPKADPPQAET